MGGLKIGVRLVMGMTQPIVLERQDLVRRLGNAAQGRSGGQTVVVGRRAVFVDVVAQVHDGVEPRLLRQGVIGVEQTAGIQLAGDDGEDDVGRHALGQGADLADGRNDVADDEPVEILPARFKPATIQVMLDGEVTRGAGAQAGRGAHLVGETGVARDLQRHLDVGPRGVGGRHAGPEDGRTRVGIAGCDPVQEGDRRAVRRGGEGGCGDGAGPDQAQKTAAVDGHGGLRRQQEPAPRRTGAPSRQA